MIGNLDGIFFLCPLPFKPGFIKSFPLLHWNLKGQKEIRTKNKKSLLGDYESPTMFVEYTLEENKYPQK